MKGKELEVFNLSLNCWIQDQLWRFSCRFNFFFPSHDSRFSSFVLLHCLPKTDSFHVNRIWKNLKSLPKSTLYQKTASLLWRPLFFSPLFILPISWLISVSIFCPIWQKQTFCTRTKCNLSGRYKIKQQNFVFVFSIWKKSNQKSRKKNKNNWNDRMKKKNMAFLYPSLADKDQHFGIVLLFFISFLLLVSLNVCKAKHCCP